MIALLRVLALVAVLLLPVLPVLGAGAADPPAADTAEPAEDEAGAADEAEKSGKAGDEEEEDDDGPEILRTPWDDRRAGEEASEQVEATMGIVRDEKVAAYVSEVGKRVARNAPRTFDYTFQVVNEDVPNAFALPGGYIFISRGLLLLANTEDELANVLGHEIIHVASRHAAARQQIVQGVPGFFQFMQFASLAAYGRNQERTADRLGQGLAALAGYDPAGLAGFLKSLEFTERLRLGAARIPSFLDTHPHTQERTGDAAARASRMSWTRKPPIAASREGYLARIDGLSVGMSASEGVFRRGRFLHPDLGFTVRFPDGWETRNTHSAVGAISPEKNANVILEFHGKGDADDLRAAAEEYEKKSRKQGLRLQEFEEVKIGGSRALRARGYASSGRGGLHVTITWIAFRGTIYRLTGLSLDGRHEGIFISTARSFRPLTPGMVQGIQETRLRIARAQEGETLTALSRRTRNQWNVNLTAVMNGVHTTQTLEPGFPVKIAVAEPYEPASAAN